jgi:hypothetical protein
MSKIGSASLCSRAGRYDNPLPTRFLAPLIADSPNFVDAKIEEGLRKALLNRILAPGGNHQLPLGTAQLISQTHKYV